MKHTLIKILVLMLALVLTFSSCGKNKDNKKGEKGDDGKSAYQLAQEAGFEGTLDEWLVSLVGEKGEIGAEVSDISLISKNGLVDTYQITFSNGATQTFTVTNGTDGLGGAPGVGIADISLTDTVGNVDTYTITMTNGSVQTFTVTNGSDGNKGDKGDKGDSGKSAYDLAVEAGFEGDVSAWLLSLVGEKGELGAEVSSVFKTATNGLVDTYTIIFSNGLISTFTVTNANSILKIEKTATSDLVDIYTITMSDGTTYPFTVTNGAKGDKGDVGPKGDKGDTGDQGIKGEKGDTGDQGRTPVFRVEGEWLQWKYNDEDDTAWRNLYETDGTPAPEGLVSVRFVLDGGSLNGSAETIYITSGISIELPIPEKHGYTFMGWFTDLNNEYAVSETYRVHESTKLYAKWEAGPIITGTKIYDLNDLLKVQNNLSGTYVLMNDINCKEYSIPLLGETETSAFTGVFEGQGYTISNFTVTSNQYMGMFGYNSGIIRNLNVDNFKFNIQNTNTSGTVYIGGIAGYNSGTITQCSATNGDIFVSLSNVRSAGLIAGGSSGKISNCYANGCVYIQQPGSSCDNAASAAGIVAVNSGEISNCYAKVTTYADSHRSTHIKEGRAALLCAKNESGGVIENCLVMGTVLGGNGGVGDICVNGSGTIKNCFIAEGTTIANDSGSIHTIATAMSLTNLSNNVFYTANLYWDSSIWKFDNVDFSKGIYPTLIQN